MLDQFKVNKAFISAGGISFTDGITDYVLEEALISRKMMERAEEAILVADHTKFGRSTFAKIAPVEHISMMITDSSCPAEWIENLGRLEIETIVSIDIGATYVLYFGYNDHSILLKTGERSEPAMMSSKKEMLSTCPKICSIDTAFMPLD